MVSQITISGNELTNIISGEFNDTLNEINKAELNLTGQNDFEKNLAVIDAVIEINAFNKLYKYKIIDEVLTEDNSIKLVCRGTEEIAVNIDIDTSLLSNASSVSGDSGVYNNVDVQDIFTDLSSHLSGWTISSTLTNTISNIRFNESQSVWNALMELANEEGFEVDVDYVNQELIVEENLGNNQVAILNERIDFEGIPTYNKKRAKAKKVIVYGKGDGKFQIKATATDPGFSVGDPTFKLNEPNIVTTSQAQARADKELARIKQNIEHYVIPQIRGFVFNISDTIIVNSQSVGLDNRELKIVRLITSISGDEEIQSIEVTNAEYSRAYKSRTQELNEENLKIRQKNTSEQGSGNTLTWGNALNANSTAPLRTVFYVPEDYVFGQTGEKNISSFTIDYEVEPFREGSGTASEDDVAPALNNATETDFHRHDPSDSGHDHIQPGQTSDNTRILVNETTNSFSNVGLSNTWTNITQEFYNNDHDLVIFSVNCFFNSVSGSGPVQIRIRRGSTTIIREEIVGSISNGWLFEFKKTYVFPSFGNTDGQTFFVDMICLGSGDTINISSGDVFFSGMLREHSHNIGLQFVDDDNAIISDNNRNPNVTGATDFHNHNVVIGDQVSDAGGINASTVSVYLDYWNGTSWVNKNSLLGLTSLLDTDVDISDGGTYPDVSGFWRTRTITNDTDADFVQNIVKMKHNLNNN